MAVEGAAGTQSRDEIEVILFDFSGTLAEEVRLFGPEDDVPAAWRDSWDARFAETGFADSWQRGDIDRTQLIGELAQRFGAEADAIESHIRNRCRAVVFHDGIMQSVRARKRRGQPQALVTINPDLFVDIEQHYDLAELFDVIVLSAKERTLDKIELCRVALGRLGGYDVRSALLIDDVAKHVRAFERTSGKGYQFTDDRTFLRDLAAGRLPLSLLP